VDPRSFDGLIRNLSGVLSRRSLVGATLGASILTTVGLRADDAAGKKKKKKTICHCPSNDPTTCRTIRVSKRARRAHLEHLCDYDGECQAGKVGTCTPPVTGCTRNNQCSGATPYCQDGVCVQCRNAGDCPCPNDTCANGACSTVCLTVTGTEGNVTPGPNGLQCGATATTTGASAFGNLLFNTIPAGTTFGELATLETDFDFATPGTCGGGSPRFVVFLANDRCPYAQFSDIPCSSDGNTGNLIGNNTPFVWNDDLCGGSAANNTYDEVLAAYGNIAVESIALVVDESPVNTERTVTLNPCITVS
jgi:hypothetical protein